MAIKCHCILLTICMCGDMLSFVTIGHKVPLYIVDHLYVCVYVVICGQHVLLYFFSQNASRNGGR